MSSSNPNPSHEPQVIHKKGNVVTVDLKAMIRETANDFNRNQCKT